MAGLTSPCLEIMYKIRNICYYLPAVIDFNVSARHFLKKKVYNFDVLESVSFT